MELIIYVGNPSRILYRSACTADYPEGNEEKRNILKDFAVGRLPKSFLDILHHLGQDEVNEHFRISTQKRGDTIAIK
jgi:hypothetical protein